MLGSWNKAAQEMFGYTEEEVLGQPLILLMPERYRDAYQRGMERIRSTGESRLVGKITELSGLRKDGSEFPFEISLASWKVGEEVFYTSIIRDITERKRSEELIRIEKQRSQEYLDIAGVMLATVNTDENITLINMKGCEILGYKERELIGKNWFDTLVPQRTRGEIRGVFRKLMAGDIKPVEYYENPLLTKGGEERLIALHNTVIRDPNGQIVGALFSAEDITKCK